VSTDVIMSEEIIIITFPFLCNAATLETSSVLGIGSFRTESTALPGTS
jgi:hypothetical protein